MNEIISDYIYNAVRHGDATEAGNPDIANAAYGEIQRLFSEIVSQGQRADLLPLLNHESPAVRTWAAFHLYAIVPDEAARVLQEASQTPGLVGFSAEMTLKQLKAGALKAP